PRAASLTRLAWGCRRPVCRSRKLCRRCEREPAYRFRSFSSCGSGIISIISREMGLPGGPRPALMHSAGELAIGSFGGRSPPKRILLVLLFASFAGKKQHQHHVLGGLRPCIPR